MHTTPLRDSLRARPWAPTRFLIVDGARGRPAPRIVPAVADFAAAWAEVVGAQIAFVARPVALTNAGHLTVQVSTAAWAEELASMNGRILSRLRAAFPSGVTRTCRKVTAIEWLAPPAKPAARVLPFRLLPFRRGV